MPPRSSPSITSTTKRAKCLSGSHSSTDGGRRNAVRRSTSRKLLIAIKPPFGANQWRDSSENQRRWVKSDRLLGALVRRVREDAGDMAHLAVGADFELAVEMEAEVRLGQDIAPFLGVLADQIVHLGPAAPGRGAERPPRDGADVLLELRGLRALDRPVAGIMHPGRDLVDDEPLMTVPVADDEHLDRQHADVFERFEHLAGDA